MQFQFWLVDSYYSCLLVNQSPGWLLVGSGMVGRSLKIALSSPRCDTWLCDWTALTKGGIGTFGSADVVDRSASYVEFSTALWCHFKT